MPTIDATLHAGARSRTCALTPASRRAHRCGSTRATVAGSLAVLLCASAPARTASADDDCPLLSAREQAESLARVYYRNTPLPPAAPPAAALSGKERAFLARTLRSESLRRLAARDLDADGILDYRIGCNGKFFENDTDVDGDGLVNVLDPQPYLPASARALPDRDGDGLPDHIDWADKGIEMDRAQQHFFQRYGIVLVERSGTFPPDYVPILEDLIATLLRDHIHACTARDGRCAQPPGMRSLRTIALEQASTREGEILAEVVAQTGTMFLYLRDTPSSMLNSFVTFAHELMHHYQFELDMSCALPWTSACTDAGFTAMKRYNVYPAPAFYTLVRGLSDWRIDEVPPPTLFAVVSHDDEVHPLARIDEPAGGDLGARVDAWFKTYGYAMEAFWRDFAPAHVIGTYSLTDPFEWHADHAAAYLLLGMEAHAQASGAFAADALPALQQCFAGLVQAEWNDSFLHRPARGAPIQDWMARTFPLDARDWERLARRYLYPIYASCAV